MPNTRRIKREIREGVAAEIASLMPTATVRYYSEREHVLGPPLDPVYAKGPNGEPIQLPRDTRHWMSVEWAAEHGIPVPENWRDYD